MESVGEEKRGEEKRREERRREESARTYQSVRHAAGLSALASVGASAAPGLAGETLTTN